jgi:branched-chain amino acid transport system substrate-binding protein
MRSLKTFGPLALVICLVSNSYSEEKIKIGVTVPLSGSAAAYGTDIKNALVFANKKLANSSYELIIEDDQCVDKEAVTVAHKLVDVDKVNFMLGFGCSGTVLASAPVYEKAKVVSIASGTGAPAITNAGDYIFRTKPSLKLAADLLAADMAKKFKKVGIITEETAYCQGLTDATVKAAEALKLEVLNENYLTGTEDFRTLLLKLKSKGVEAIFLNPQAEPSMVNQYKQFLALEWKIPIYGTFQPGSPVFLDAFGKAADGIIYADLQFNSEMLNEVGRKLYSEFEEEYGKAKSAEHYSALSLVSFSAMNEAIKSGSDVKEFLYQHKFTDLVDGYSFDQNGDVVSQKVTYTLKTIFNGKPAKLNNPLKNSLSGS